MKRKHERKIRGNTKITEHFQTNLEKKSYFNISPVVRMLNSELIREKLKFFNPFILGLEWISYVFFFVLGVRLEILKYVYVSADKIPFRRYTA